MARRITKEMENIIEELYQAVDMNCEACCEACPYADRCGKEELFWGCFVWEDSMGEDL